MLTDTDKDLVQQCMNALRDGIAGFRTRRPQLEMVAAVANTLACCRQEPNEGGGGRGEHIAVIEAGTGTGKSFGALVPALVMARTLGKRLVVSSSTVALQHQYAEKDAPMLQALLPLDFSFAVAKGRRRYACTARLMAAGTAAGQQALLPDEARDERIGLQGQFHSASLAATESALRRQRRIVVGLAESFEAGRWNGDRDELAVPVADELWADLTTDRQGCSGNRCPDFARCPFQAARQRAKEADLVIANHDLVLSALDMEAGSVLPPASETFYVFDEAHSLSAKVVEHFAARHALRGARDWVQGATDAVRDAVLALRLDDGLLRDARDQARCIDEALGELYRLIHATRAFEMKRARRFRSGELPDWVLQHGGALHAAASDLQKTFAGLREAVLQRAPIEGSLATQVLSALGLPTDMDYMEYVDAEYAGVPVRVCRTGYTGEQGYELLPGWDSAPVVFDALAAEVERRGGQLAGLGARDTLRTEMGYPLHGHELSLDISPLQARCGWAVGWSKDGFWGRDALLAEKKDGPRRVLRGLRATGRGVPRAGMTVLRDAAPIGVVTSGTFSPTLGAGIALALIDVDADVADGDPVSVDVRGRALDCDVVKPPFVDVKTR